MAKGMVSDRQKFALYLVLNPMQHNTRAERKRVDKFWDDIGLEEIAKRAEKSVNALDFSPDAHEVEMTSDNRDLIIEICSRPGINTAIGRILNPLEQELIKGRDG